MVKPGGLNRKTCFGTLGGPRLLLRRLREVMAEPGQPAGTARQDRRPYRGEHGRGSLLGLCAAR